MDEHDPAPSAVEVHPQRTVVITGGVHGIGRAVSERLACGGARVAILDVDAVGATEAADRARGLGAAAAVGIACDVGDDASVGSAIDRVESSLGPIDWLVANAGIDVGGLAHEIGWQVWERVLAVNLSGTFSVCRHVIRGMVAAGRPGSIVCTSSPAAEVALPRSPAYSASKAGVSALVRGLAVDYAVHGIRVNAVAPGPTDTALMWANSAPDERERIMATVASEVPLGRLATPAEIAEAIVWLLSERATYVTGAVLACDGGVLAKASVSV